MSRFVTFNQLGTQNPRFFVSVQTSFDHRGVPFPKKTAFEFFLFFSFFLFQGLAMTGFNGWGGSITNLGIFF